MITISLATGGDGRGSRPRRRRRVVPSHQGDKFWGRLLYGKHDRNRRIVVATVHLGCLQCRVRGDRAGVQADVLDDGRDGHVRELNAASAPADPDEMSGMDMSGSNPTPAPTMDPDMPGMDMSGTAPPTDAHDGPQHARDGHARPPHPPTPTPMSDAPAHHSAPTCPAWTCRDVT